MRHHKGIFGPTHVLDLVTSIGNGVLVDGVIGNAAGPWKSVECLATLGRTPAAVLTLGSMTKEELKGNSPPYYHCDPGGVYAQNSFGLANKGVSAYLQEFSPLKRFKKPIVFSYAGESIAEFVGQARLGLGQGLIHELNGSCPNRDTKSRLICFDLPLWGDLIRGVLAATGLETVLVKVSPSTDIGYIREACALYNQTGVHGVVLANTVPNTLVLDPITNQPTISRNGLAGLSGPAVRPIVMGQVYQYRQLLDPKIQIIAEGGITTGRDIWDYFRAGASFCRVGTAYQEEGPGVFTRLHLEFEEVMRSQHVHAVTDIPRLDGLPKIHIS